MSKFVHGLIKSMSFREKSYFKRYAEIHSKKEKNYVRLFDVINQMQTYDEEKIKQKFEGETIVKYLSSEVKYLKEQLLKSLTNYHFGSSTTQKLQKLILYIEVLIAKGFQKQAYKILKKAKKLAYQHEDFTTILKLIQLDEDLLFEQGILGYTQHLDDLQKERQPIYDKIQNLNYLRLLREQVRDFQFDGYIADISQYPQFYDQPVLKHSENALSLKAKEHWYYIWCLLYYVNRNYRESLNVSLEAYNLVKQDEVLFPPSRMLPIISNLLYFSALQNETEIFYEYFSLLDGYSSKSVSRMVYINYIRHARLTELYFQSNDIQKTINEIKNVQKFIENNDDKLGAVQRDVLYFNSIRGSISSQQFEFGISLLNNWFAYGVQEFNLVPSRLFSLILHLELGWFDLLNSEVKSVNKLFKTHKSQNDLTNAFLSFISTYLKRMHKPKTSFEQVLEDLRKVKSNPESNHEFEKFDYLKWCEDKALN